MTVDIDDAPVRIEHMWVDGIGPQPTLIGMADGADAIVVASIAGERFHVGQTCLPQTLVTLALEDVIKNHARVASSGGRLVVWRHGGKRLKDQMVVGLEQSGFPSFKVGERYLLFLSWNERQDQWQVTFPYTTLKVEGAALVPVADSGPLTESGRDKELSAFAAHLRTLIARH